MISKNKICIGLMVILIFQVYFIKLNSNKDVIKETKTKDVNEMFKELNEIKDIKILEIGKDKDRALGKIEIKGTGNEILEVMDKIKSYKINDYEITLKEGIYNINMDIK